MAKINGWVIEFIENDKGFGIFLSEDGKEAVVKYRGHDIALLKGFDVGIAEIAVYAPRATIALNHEKRKIIISKYK